MRQVEPAFFIHSGDAIYADGPIAAEQAMPDGGVWQNLTTEAKAKVAETLAEFRGNYVYNLMDERAALQRRGADARPVGRPRRHRQLVPARGSRRRSRKGRLQGDQRRSAGGARRAGRSWSTCRCAGIRSIRSGCTRRSAMAPRSTCSASTCAPIAVPNTANDQAKPGPDTAFLGPEQIRWLKQALLASRATWKVIAADMPLGLIVWDDFRARQGSEAVAQGISGPPRGRELEIADLRRFIRDDGIRNVVWLTADVHYTAAHYYDPERARFQEFAPFWEFVSGR